MAQRLNVGLALRWESELGGTCFSSFTTDGYSPRCVTYSKWVSPTYVTLKGCYNDFWAVGTSRTAFAMSNVVSSTSSNTSSSTSSTSTTFPSIIATVSSSSSNQSHSNTGAIVGGVVGGVAVIALAVCIIVWLIVRRRRGARTSGPPAAATNAPGMSQPAIQPYAVPPVQHPTSPDSQAKGWNQQNAPQQRPVSMSPVPQYTPGSHFSGVGGQGAPHEASAVNARGTGNNAAELG
ncbi:hypothetical protein CcaCcLH18_02660 [Colletotrichum camelliae]|nr:hypothetical protein CcaCcLH18_02660 [Colletotrichum camelliae]